MKRNTTRIIALFVCWILIITLMACGGGSSDEQNTNQPPQATPAPIPARNTVWFATPAIGADVGEVINLAEYNVQFSQDEIIPNYEIKWSSDELTIIDNKVSSDAVGIYKLTAQSGSETKSIYLLVKDAQEEEYVLYYNDFSQDSMDSIEVTEQTDRATVVIEDGKLKLSAAARAADCVKILFPEFLSDFGDYVITTNATITQKVNTTRWMSVMYRIQNNSEPYYHFCVRAKATIDSGLELSGRTENKTWEYFNKVPYSEDILADKMYEFKMDVHGYYTECYINGKKVNETDANTKQLLGRVGLQVSGCDAVFDDIKIVAKMADVEKYIKELVQVRDINTNIALAPSIISEVKTSEDLSRIIFDSPTVAIMTINGNGDVIDSNGTKIATMLEACECLSGRIIPAFRVKDQAAADALIKFVEDTDALDVMVVSENGSLIQRVREKAGIVKGVLDFTKRTDLTTQKLGEIRSETNKSTSRICLLPASFASKSNTEFLTALCTTVWYACSDNTVAENYKLITCGANGILTANRKMTEDCLTNDKLFAENSIIRPVYTIGHRGMPSAAQENSVAGSLKAIQNGAKIVENDVYLTKDNVVVIMHDGNIDRTTNGTGNIESFTYEELSKFKIDSYSGAAPEPIPTLEDYFKAIKGTGANLFIEIKSSKSQIVKEIKKLIDQYDIADQCCIITFNASQLALSRKDIPEISSGFLTSMTTLENIIKATSNHDSTFNPSSAGVTQRLLTQAAYRGISIWPWTVNSQSSFDNFYLMGTWGVTTDYSNFTSNYVKHLLADNDKYEVKKGGSANVAITYMTYAGQEKAAKNCEMFIVDGANGVSFDGNKITGSKAGTYTVVFRYSYKLASSKTAYAFTEPVTITVK